MGWPRGGGSEGLIAKDELRLALLKMSPDKPHLGETPKWFHRRCEARRIQCVLWPFPRPPPPVGWCEGIKLPGFNTVPLAPLVPGMFEGIDFIRKEDANDLAALFDSARTAAGIAKTDWQQEANPGKKAKSESELELQSKLVWKARDKLQGVPNKDIKLALSAAGLPSSGGASDLQRRLANAMVFGVPRPCTDCGSRSWHVEPDGYTCMGSFDEYTPCISRTQTVAADKLELDGAIAAVPALAKYQCTTLVRVFREPLRPRATSSNAVPPSPKPEPTLIIAPGGHVELHGLKTEELNGQTGVAQRLNAEGRWEVQLADSGAVKAIKPDNLRPREAPRLALAGRRIALAGRLVRGAVKVKELVESLGGKMAFAVNSATMCLVTTEAELEKNGKKVRDAKEFGVPIVSEGFLTECEATKKCGLLAPHLLFCTSTVIEPVSCAYPPSPTLARPT